MHEHRCGTHTHTPTHAHTHTHTGLQCRIHSQSDTWTGIALLTGALIQLNSQTNAYTHTHTYIHALINAKETYSYEQHSPLEPLRDPSYISVSINCTEPVCLIYVF